ncbi:hypothetical protein EVAR_68807_1 [Eumeta japonica]|uniref:Uncharacterized protein n=1 Tax=Eumeta variegata TaxID=151549 RepID=A0A4C1YXJ0_EUMVA|nr:hypothetical protein EVAR_68807_1 [Eumeta japonica]
MALAVTGPAGRPPMHSYPIEGPSSPPSRPSAGRRLPTTVVIITTTTSGTEGLTRSARHGVDQFVYVRNEPTTCRQYRTACYVTKKGTVATVPAAAARDPPRDCAGDIANLSPDHRYDIITRAAFPAKRHIFIGFRIRSLRRFYVGVKLLQT